VDEGIYSLFAYHVEVKPPENETHLVYSKDRSNGTLRSERFEITRTT
jgi:hypothetical protein